MFFLSKKNFFIIIFFIILFIGITLTTNFYNRIALETISLPVANKIIILDAGHGYPDERG